MNIIIPSYKRSDNLLGKDYFHMGIYCVPESQKQDYIDAVGDKRVVAIPDEHDGDIVKKAKLDIKKHSQAVNYD
jgi:hypothetical protein